MKILFSVCACAFLLVLAVPARGQDDDGAAERMLLLEMNRIQSVFQLAHNGIVGSRQLEPVGEQIDKFSELQLKREEIQKSINLVGGIKDREERMEKWQQILTSMKSLETELKENVLLPHQNDMLKQSEFSLLLSRLNGDFAKVIETYYNEQFGLTEKQAEQLVKLRKEISDKKRELSQEYNRKIQELEKRNREKLSSIFSPRQKEMIERLSGKKLVVTNSAGK